MFEPIRGGCGTTAPNEFIEDLSEMEKTVLLFKEAGMDYINVSTNIAAPTPVTTRPGQPPRQIDLNHFRYTRRVKELVPDKTVIGSAYSVLAEEAATLADENIAKGYTDCAGFGRQSFADPLYPAKLLSGQAINYCTACSLCAKLMMAEENDGCIVHNPYYRELSKKLIQK